MTERWLSVCAPSPLRFNALFLSEGWAVYLAAHAGNSGGRWFGGALLCRQAGHQGEWRAPAHQSVGYGSAHRQLHADVDVDGTDVWLDLGAVWPDPPPHYQLP